MKEFTVIVSIENKPFINDPEAETIYRDLILKNNYNKIKSVRTAKLLRFIITANNPMEAESGIKKMCDDLRIFNPLVSDCQVNIISEN